MADKWKVNDGVQVVLGGKLYGPGDTVTATEDELAAEGATGYVSAARSQAQAPSANKAQAAPKPHEASKANDK